MYVAADGTLYAPEHEHRASGSSRTPSPSPRSLPARMPGSSVSSFDEEATPLPQNRNQSYAQQQSQAMFVQPNSGRPSPIPVQSFYSAYVRPEGQLYGIQQHGHLQSPTPRVHEHPSAPRTPISSVPLRHTPHGPRALISHSRTPSPDLAMHAQMRAPAALAAGAVGMGGDNLSGKFQNLELSGGTSPPPGFGPHSPHQTVYPEPRHQLYRSMPPDPVPQQQPPSSIHTGSRHEDDEEYPLDVPIVPSSKALGKRRAVEKPVDRKRAYFTNDTLSLHSYCLLAISQRTHSTPTTSSRTHDVLRRQYLCMASRWTTLRTMVQAILTMTTAITDTTSPRSR